MKLKTFTKVALATALSLIPLKTKAESWNLNLFPEIPVYRSVISDPEILKTEINLPKGLEKEVLDKSFKELAPYISLSKELPLISFNIKNRYLPSRIPKEIVENSEERAIRERIFLSDDIFSALLVAGGRLKFPKDEAPKYTAKTELFLSSPMIDDYFSDGNKLIAVAGIKNEGSVNTNGLEDASIRSLPNFFVENTYSYLGDLYIVAKSPYSRQYVLLRIGAENIGGTTTKKQTLNVSTVLELPSLTCLSKELENFKILPYISLSAKDPLGDSNRKFSAEVGAKLTGASNKSMMLYWKADYSSEKNEYFTGLKLEL